MRFLCKVPSYLKLLTFPSTTALQRKLTFGAMDFSPLRHAPLSRNVNIIPKFAYGGARKILQNVARGESAALKMQIQNAAKMAYPPRP